MSKAILYDATLCIGCKQCEGACAQQNGLPYDDKVAAESVQSAHKFTVVLTKTTNIMRRLCMHCEEPACASVCPVGALHKTKDGPVVYDVWKCLGCRYCMVACAFSVPKYEWGKLNPRVRKCIMCPDRVAEGKQTACAEICPVGATKFGDRDALVAEAQDRLRQNPVELRSSYLRSERSGRNLCSAALLCAFPAVRLAESPSVSAILRCLSTPAG